MRYIKKIQKPQQDMSILYLLMFVSSWAYIMPSTWFDECCILLLAVYAVATNKKLDKFQIRVASIYILWCLIGLIVNRRISMYSLFIMIDNFKPLLLLFLVMTLDINKEKLERLLRAFEIINFPSFVIGILNAVRYNYLHQSLLIESGTLKRVNSIIIARAGGLVGHSGTFSSICCVMFVLALFIEKPGLKKWIKLVFYGFSLYCGYGRVPIAVAIFAVLWFLWLHISEKNRKYLIIIFGMVVCLSLASLIKYLQVLFKVDFEGSIRFRALGVIFRNISSVLLFGVGIGNLGNSNSIKNNYDLYLQLDMTKYGTIDWESQLAKGLLQTGMIGSMIWYLPFIKYFIIIYKGGKSEHRDLTLFLLAYFIADTFINKSYTLPCPLVIYMLIVFQLNRNKIAEEQEIVVKRGVV